MRSIEHLVRLLVSRLPTHSPAALGRRLIGRANAERDAKNFQVASALYEEALRLVPNNPRFFMQYGHMLKEAGDHGAAEQYYAKAAQILPNEPDIAIQLGHFYKVAGRPDEARSAYMHALGLRPGWLEAQREAAAVGGSPLGAGGDGIGPSDAVVPELLPQPVRLSGAKMREGFFIRRLGAARIRQRGGYRRALRGIEALHGFIVSGVDLEELTISIEGELLRRERLDSSLLYGGGQSKYVFNVWHDFSGLPEGARQIELRASRKGRPDLVHRSVVEIAAPVSEADYESSDAIVGPFLPDGRTLEEQINNRTSMVRRAQRRVLAEAPRAILIQRADQLGDLVCSVPALERLRTLFPKARLVALVTNANADLARTLEMLDDVVAIDFPEAEDGHKSLSSTDQEAVRAKLASFAFDIAIDFGETAASRPLLLLSGAPFLYGFKDGQFPWLTAGFELNTHDPGNHGPIAATAHKLVAMVDALGELVAQKPFTLQRQDLDKARLSAYGIDPAKRYVVLHTGARLAYSRWPGFAKLAALLLEQSDATIVVMGDEPMLPMPASERLITITERLDFDDFDSLLSFGSLFIGNDSGPKHLASLRGVPVISLHMARLNWNEWGQEPSGLIVSRRVPCAGCGISQDAEDCGKAFACLTHITPDEVLEAALSLLDSSGGSLQSVTG